MPDFSITLGGFTFQDFDIPSALPFGGEQAMTIHKLIGGGRIIDVYGNDDAPISWSGLFLGPDANARAKQLNQLKSDGNPLDLVWDDHRYSVVIRSFLPIYELFSRVRYTISCEVLEDLTDPAPDFDISDEQQFSLDLDSSSNWASALSLDAVTAAVSQIQSVLAVSGSLGGSTGNQLGQIAGLVGQAAAAVVPIVSINDTILSGAAPFGVLNASAGIASNISLLRTNAGAAATLPAAFALANNLGRMSKIISRVGT